MTVPSNIKLFSFLKSYKWPHSIQLVLILKNVGFDIKKCSMLILIPKQGWNVAQREGLNV